MPEAVCCATSVPSPALSAITITRSVQFAKRLVGDSIFVEVQQPCCIGALDMESVMIQQRLIHCTKKTWLPVLILS